MELNLVIAHANSDHISDQDRQFNISVNHGGETLESVSYVEDSEKSKNCCIKFSKTSGSSHLPYFQIEILSQAHKNHPCYFRVPISSNIVKEQERTLSNSKLSLSVRFTWHGDDSIEAKPKELFSVFADGYPQV